MQTSRAVRIGEKLGCHVASEARPSVCVSWSEEKL